MNLQYIFTDVSTLIFGQKWALLAVLLSSYLVLILSDDSRFPISASKLFKGWDTNRWKPVVVVLASLLYGLLALRFQQGMDWQHALALTVKAAFGTFGLYTVVVKAIWNDNLPKAVKAIALIPMNSSSANKFPTPPPPPTE